MDVSVDDDSELTRQAKRDAVQLLTAHWGDLADSHRVWNEISGEVASTILSGVTVANQQQADQLSQRVATYLYASTLFARKLVEVAVLLDNPGSLSSAADPTPEDIKQFIQRCRRVVELAAAEFTS